MPRETDADDSMTDGAGPARAGVRPWYSWYVVLVLTLIYAISFVDRQMLSLLIEPIRRDLGISDTQIGLLTGFAFAAVYAVLGVALGRIADSWHRVKLVAIGLGAWSVATAACGLARSFGQLFVARMAVGAGEASLTPTAYSIFSDYFPPRRLGRAVAVYTLAQYIGAGTALLLGGLLVGRLADLPAITVGGLRFQPWQIAMIAVGIPGLLILPLLTTVREPERRGAERDEAAVGSVLARLKAERVVYLSHFTGFSLAGLFATGYTTWLPEYLRRSHGWPIEKAGLALALILIVVGGPSTLFGGWLADRLRAKGYYAAPIWIGVVALLLAWPLGIWAPLAGTATLSLVLIALVVAFLTAPTAAAPAALQIVTPNRMRAQISAVYLLCTNLIGAGAGPLVVGLATDQVFGNDAALPASLSLVAAVTCPTAALALFLGRRAFARAAASASDA